MVTFLPLWSLDADIPESPWRPLCALGTERPRGTLRSGKKKKVDQLPVINAVRQGVCLVSVTEWVVVKTLPAEDEGFEE